MTFEYRHLPTWSPCAGRVACSGAVSRAAPIEVTPRSGGPRGPYPAGSEHVVDERVAELSTAWVHPHVCQPSTSPDRSNAPGPAWELARAHDDRRSVANGSTHGNLNGVPSARAGEPDAPTTDVPLRGVRIVGGGGVRRSTNGSPINSGDGASCRRSTRGGAAVACDRPVSKRSPVRESGHAIAFPCWSRSRLCRSCGLTPSTSSRPFDRNTRHGTMGRLGLVSLPRESSHTKAALYWSPPS